MDHFGALFDHFEIGHICGEMSEPGSDEHQHQAPESGSKCGKEGEAFEIHIAQPGWQGDQLPDSWQQSADKGCQFSIFEENLIGAVERWPGKKKVFSIALQKGPSQFLREEIVDISASQGTGQPSQKGEGKVDGGLLKRQFATPGEEAGGDHDYFAGERDKGTLNRHEEKDQKEAPDRSVGGQAFNVQSKCFSHRKIFQD